MPIIETLCSIYEIKEKILQVITFPEKKIREIRESILPSLLDIYRREVSYIIKETGDNKSHVRANFMIPIDKDKSKLKISFSSGDFEKLEFDTVWNSGDGCCGTAWETQKFTIASEDFEYSPELKEYFDTILIKNVYSQPVKKKIKKNVSEYLI